MTVAQSEPPIKALKILARALDPGCQDGEAETAAVMFVRNCRRERLGLPDLVKALAIAPAIKTLKDDRPPACKVEFTFGKYDRWSVGDVAMRDPDYLIWAINNLKKPELVNAMKIAAEFYGLKGAA